MQTISLIKKRKGEPVKSLEHLDHTHMTDVAQSAETLLEASLWISNWCYHSGIQPRLVNFKSTQKATVNTACCTGGPLLALNYSSVIPQGL